MIVLQHRETKLHGQRKLLVLLENNVVARNARQAEVLRQTGEAVMTRPPNLKRRVLF